MPLNLTIETFGNLRPADGNRFAIERVSVGEPGETETPATSDVQEQFAPAHFFEITEAEKLSRKSFERYDAGLRVTDSEQLEAAYAAKRDVEYELFYIDRQRNLRRCLPSSCLSRWRSIPGAREGPSRLHCCPLPTRPSRLWHRRRCGSTRSGLPKSTCAT